MRWYNHFICVRVWVWILDILKLEKKTWKTQFKKKYLKRKLLNAYYEHVVHFLMSHPSCFSPQFLIHSDKYKLTRGVAKIVYRSFFTIHTHTHTFTVDRRPMASRHRLQKQLHRPLTSHHRRIICERKAYQFEGQLRTTAAAVRR